MALLNIFANFFIDTNERYLRMMDSFHSFKDINAEKWIINARGKFAKDTMSFLRDQLGTQLTAHQRHSKEGWFHDTRQMLPDIDGDYIIFWLEDHINMANIDVLNEIVSEMKEKDLDYMFHSFWQKGRLRERYRGVQLTRGRHLDYFEHNVTNNPTIQSNLGGSYIISAASICKLSLFSKIVLSDDPIPRRWPIETPFDFEKAPNDTHWLPIKVALPRQEVFASIDCDHGCDGYSLQSRGLYPKREGRKSYADPRTWEDEHVELSQEIKPFMSDSRSYEPHNKHNEYLPFMDETEIKAISCSFKIFHKPINVLEWGSGYSTTYFSRYLPEEGSEWHSIEHNSKWAEYVKSLVGHSEVANVHVHYVPNIGVYQEGIDDGSFEVFRDYVLFPLDLKNRFHIIMVDGRARIYCMKVGWQLLDNDGVMILHDAQRKQYNSGIPNDCFWLRVVKQDVNFEKISTIFIARSHAVISAIRLSIGGVLPDSVEISCNFSESCGTEAYEAIGNFTKQQDEGLISAGDMNIPQDVVVGSVGEKGRPGFSHADTNGASERDETKPGAASALFLTTYYSGFMTSFYEKRFNLSKKCYEEQKSALVNQFFGDSDYYSKGLEKAGWKADDIIINCAPLQEAWARESGVAKNDQGIVIEKIRSTRPQVVYLHDLSVATDVFISAIRPYTKLIVGQIASPIPKQCNISGFDIIFSSFPHFVERFRKMGVASYYQPLAFDPRVLEKMGEYQRIYPVTFIGGISQLHAKGYQLLETLAELLPIGVWGYGLESVPEDSPIRKRHNGEVWGLDMFSLLSQSRITLNRHIDVAENYANNMRLFEATGCGALLITDHKDNLNELFEIGKEVVSYRSIEECVALVKYYMQNPEEGEEIARAGQERTLRDHTYTKRMEQTAEILERHLRYKQEKDRCSVPV